MKKILLITTSIAIIFGFGYHIARADWEAPPPGVPPPEGDIAAPLNVSSFDQIKDGGLELCNDGEPDCKLDVGGNIISSGDYSLGTSDDPWQELQLEGASGQGKIFFGANNFLIYEDQKYKFYGNLTPKLTIDSDGRLIATAGLEAAGNKFNVSNDGSLVGINITDPDPAYSLHVDGKILAGGGDGDISKITGSLLVGDSVAQGYLRVQQDGYLIVGQNTSYQSIAKTESYGYENYSGVYGETEADNPAQHAGIKGYAPDATGIYGEGDYGVWGVSSGTYGVYGVNNVPGLKTRLKGIAVAARGPDQVGGSIGSGYYYSTAVGANGGRVSGLDGNFESYAVYAIGGNIDDVPMGNPTQETFAVRGIAGEIDSANSGSLRTYGIYGESADTHSTPGAASYAGYFIGDVTVKDGDLYVDGGSLSVSSNSQDHSVRSQQLTVTFDGEDLFGDSALDIDKGDLIIDSNEELVFSDEDDVKAYYKYEGGQNCLKLRINEEIVDQIGPSEGITCEPLCERSGGRCRATECPDGYHHEEGYFCDVQYAYNCCFPGEEAYEQE